MIQHIRTELDKSFHVIEAQFRKGIITDLEYYEAKICYDKIILVLDEMEHNLAKLALIRELEIRTETLKEK